jgi:hypothetical protein
MRSQCTRPGSDDLVDRGIIVQCQCCFYELILLIFYANPNLFIRLHAIGSQLRIYVKLLYVPKFAQSSWWIS